MTPITAGDVPCLPRGVRMRFDAVRNAHVLLAPERAFNLDQIALSVLNLVDGRRRVCDIVDILATTYDADRTVIEADVVAMLSDLAMKRVIETVRSPSGASGQESLENHKNRAS